MAHGLADADSRFIRRFRHRFPCVGPLAALITAAVFASSTIAGKFASEALDPRSIILARSLIALIFLAILAAPQGAAAFKVSPRHLLPIALLGLSGIVGYVYFFLWSLHHTSLSYTAIISSLGPVITAVAAAMLLGERLSIRSYFGAWYPFAGCCCCSPREIEMWLRAFGLTTAIA